MRHDRVVKEALADSMFGTNYQDLSWDQRRLLFRTEASTEQHALHELATCYKAQQHLEDEELRLPSFSDYSEYNENDLSSSYPHPSSHHRHNPRAFGSSSSPHLSDEDALSYKAHLSFDSNHRNDYPYNHHRYRHPSHPLDFPRNHTPVQWHKGERNELMGGRDEGERLHRECFNQNILPDVHPKEEGEESPGRLGGRNQKDKDEMGHRDFHKTNRHAAAAAARAHHTGGAKHGRSVLHPA